MSVTDKKPGPPVLKPAPPVLRRLPLIVILCAAVIGAFTLRDVFSFEELAANRDRLLAFRDANYLLTALGFVLVYITIVALSLPGALIATLTGGFLFGIFPGTLLTVAAATTGATFLFWAARMGGGARLAARLDAAGGRTGQMHEALKENQIPVLFLLRLVPVVPFFVANLLPALVGVSTRVFVLTTFFGIMPGSLVYTSVGAGLGEVFAEGGVPDLGIIFTPRILLPLLGLAVLAVLPIVVRRVRNGR